MNDYLKLIPDFDVLLRCDTYNQKDVIQQTLFGFNMQNTSFPFVCLVIDDNSTDDEQEVLRSFIDNQCDKSFFNNYEEKLANVIITRSQSNRNCFFAFYFLKENLFKQQEKKNSLVHHWRERCKYIAFCEGDDYWIDPLKLQKQVDFMDDHDDYLLIGSNGLVMHTDTSKGIQYFNDCHETREITFQELVKRWFFPTASLLFRPSVYDQYPSWSEELHYGDDVLVFTCAMQGKVACLGDITCVYRKGGGITTVLDKQYVYMYEQHILFYGHLLKDTGDLYKDCLVEKINQLNQELKYYSLKEKHAFLIPILYPKRSLKSFVKKLYKIIIKK